MNVVVYSQKLQGEWLSQLVTGCTLVLAHALALALAFARPVRMFCTVAIPVEIVVGIFKFEILAERLVTIMRRNNALARTKQVVVYLISDFAWKGKKRMHTISFLDYKPSPALHNAQAASCS